MNTNLTEIVFILDRSGSMQHLVQDTIGGYNSFIEEQKKTVGDAFLTTILFDDKYEVLHDRVNIKNVKPLTEADYTVRGMTALLDSMGKAINSIGDRLAKTDEADRPANVIFVITTDGEENSSNEFSQSQIKGMVEHQTSKYNWQFVFLGANIDAISTANNYGIHFAANYSADSIGTASVYTTMSRGISDIRARGCSTNCSATFDSSILDEVE